MMEGTTSEAASMAGNLKSGRLIYFYDDNNITIEGDTNLAFSENVGQRFEGYGWHVQHVADINDLETLDQAIHTAKAETEKPSLIIVKSKIGYGSPHKQGSHDAHGAPLGAEEIILTKSNLGWPSEEPFFVPTESLNFFRQAVERGEEQTAQEWQKLYDAYSAEYPELAAQWQAGTAAASWPMAGTSDIPIFKAGEAVATRVAGVKRSTPSRLNCPTSLVVPPISLLPTIPT